MLLTDTMGSNLGNNWSYLPAMKENVLLASVALQYEGNLSRKSLFQHPDLLPRVERGRCQKEQCTRSERS